VTLVTDSLCHAMTDPAARVDDAAEALRQILVVKNLAAPIICLQTLGCVVVAGRCTIGGPSG
jgi:hypothetical protein